jgi:hypothetical protein
MRRAAVPAYRSFMDRASAERAREAMCNEIVHGVEMRIGEPKPKPKTRM